MILLVQLKFWYLVHRTEIKYKVLRRSSQAEVM